MSTSKPSSSAQRVMRVVHLITGLDTGGAELMLCRLAATFSPSAVESTIISLAHPGPLADALAARGIRVVGLGMRPGGLNAAGLYRAFRLLREIKPDVVQTWLYHADFAGLVAGTLAGVPSIVWNIRCATLDPRDHPATLSMLRRMLAMTSRWPSAVICNSVAGLDAHRELGYHPRRWIVIPNGFDTELYRPSSTARAEFRRELGLAGTVPLVGLMARLHPMKDHGTFIEAAAEVANGRPDAHFVMVGRGVHESPLVRDLLRRFSLDSCVHLMADRPDPAHVLAALDVAVSSSYSEAFPNVVGEAMACGTPAVVTAAGDSKIIVGDTGRVVPSRNPHALAAGILEILAMSADERARLGLAARARIINEYSLPAVTACYQRLYEELSNSAAVVTAG